jgi:hypothetical protein
LRELICPICFDIVRYLHRVGYLRQSRSFDPRPVRYEPSRCFECQRKHGARIFTRQELGDLAELKIMSL